MRRAVLCMGLNLAIHTPQIAKLRIERPLLRPEQWSSTVPWVEDIPLVENSMLTSTPQKSDEYSAEDRSSLIHFFDVRALLAGGSESAKAMAAPPSLSCEMMRSTMMSLTTGLTPACSHSLTTEGFSIAIPC